MVSQFISPDNVGLLGDINFSFPEGTHAIGRLDSESEGLLLLTTNKKVTRLLFESEVPHRRTYLVRVRYEVGPETLETLRNGVAIRIKGGVDWVTTPCEVNIIDTPTLPGPGDVLFHEKIPHTWLEITLTEGKFHQVRKMVKMVRHKCQRLIRTSIGDMQLGDLQPGQVREMSEDVFFRLLRIERY